MERFAGAGDGGGGALPIDPGDLTLVMRIQRLYYYGNSTTQ